VSASGAPPKPVTTLVVGRSRTEAPARQPSRYVLGAELASGGMGRVVDGTDTVLGRSVAVKQALHDDPESLRRFEREMTITARLEHPSIVPLYDAGHTDDGAPFYVMRRVSGKSLDDLVRAARTIEHRLALVPHVLAAAQAIAHAHQRGVIHRDVKPHNILVGELGETVVIDWGLAKIIGDVEARAEYAHDVAAADTRVGTTLGTPGFMAPEQLGDPNVDERADVYALGATLYYVLAGTPPQVASTVEALAKAPRKPPLRELVPGVPAELSTICDTALTTDRAVRYRDAGALADELQRFLTGQLVASHRYSTAQRMARFVRRNRVAVAALAIAAVAIAAVSWWAIARVIAARDEAIADREATRIARDREAERADEVTLSRARMLLDTNPTHAVALIKPLARTRWRDVAPIAADARASGVAWQLPGIGRANSMEITPDGVHAVVATSSGAIRVYDLKAHTGRTVAELGASAAVACLDDTHVVATSKRGITAIDLETGDVRVVDPSPAADLRASSGSAMWVDHDGRAWRLAGEAAESIAIPEPATLILPSPDGTQALAAGRTKVWLVGTGTPKPLATGEASSLAWGERGDRFAAIADGAMIGGRLGEPPFRRAMPQTMSVAVVGDHLYTSGLDGIAIDGARPDGWETGNFTHGISVAAGDLVVTPVTEGAITVMFGRQRQLLLPPEPSIEQIATSPRSHYVVAQYRSKLFAWDLDELLPRRVPAREDSFETLALRPHYVLVIYPSGGPSEWFDLAAGTRSPGPPLKPLVFVSTPQHGDHVVLTAGDGSASLVHRGHPEIVPLATGISAAAFMDDTHVALSGGGAVRLVDVATRTSSPLANVDASWLYAAGDWLVAGKGDTIARIHRGTRPEVMTRKRTTHHKRLAGAAVTADGRAWLAEGARIECWRPDGTIATHATFPDVITSVDRIDDHQLFVRIDSSDTYVVDLDEPNRFRASTRLDQMFEIAGGVTAGHRDLRTMSLGTPVSEGGVVVTELATGASRRVARLIDRNDMVNVTADARYLFTEVGSGGGVMQVWPIGLPGSPDDTAAWLDAMTNATVDRNGALAWP
jgi:hypothetical protein